MSENHDENIYIHLPSLCSKSSNSRVQSDSNGRHKSNNSPLTLNLTLKKYIDLLNYLKKYNNKIK